VLVREKRPPAVEEGLDLEQYRKVIGTEGDDELRTRLGECLVLSGVAAGVTEVKATLTVRKAREPVPEGVAV
jgi:hypothetical protein